MGAGLVDIVFDGVAAARKKAAFFAVVAVVHALACAACGYGYASVGLQIPHYATTGRTNKSSAKALVSVQRNR